MADHDREWTACKEEDDGGVVNHKDIPALMAAAIATSPDTMPAAGAPSFVVTAMEVSGPAAAAPSSMAEHMEVSGPTAAAPSSQEATTLADRLSGTTRQKPNSGFWGNPRDISSLEVEFLSPGDEAGPKSACEEDNEREDNERVFVEYNDFPTLPTYPKGAIDFSRLGLIGASSPCPFTGLELKADPILTRLDYNFNDLRRAAELDYVYACRMMISKRHGHEGSPASGTTPGRMLRTADIIYVTRRGTNDPGLFRTRFGLPTGLRFY
ncbi:hypothetical protein THAOC_35543 [Thalassiosira oceanica]|uniref:Uncharacterized protein n=1 Tax=Thalassiosira oceanica TaxID=159749 RepID=K0R0R3_THAOC|nr:hypothetical protein THAOC_35543 [Thalassiosira oceanica]|eukprot:EJK45823.1 hypothetical protein THAOC_35543 [Thalassiosira oceanica]